MRVRAGNIPRINLTSNRWERKFEKLETCWKTKPETLHSTPLALIQSTVYSLQSTLTNTPPIPMSTKLVVYSLSPSVPITNKSVDITKIRQRPQWSLDSLTSTPWWIEEPLLFFSYKSAGLVIFLGQFVSRWVSFEELKSKKSWKQTKKDGKI
jgi:hypothetical protein